MTSGPEDPRIRPLEAKVVAMEACVKQLTKCLCEVEMGAPFNVDLEDLLQAVKELDESP